ncbi:hypothetical protein TWF225_005008 [Orbilia oligospora]|nr:hypothetical protein TWF225_005008 [Orbilia oligospora]KAF3241862.1 hypothetical protein TWF217_011900 [Orbilia oligospora]KAF3262664.1 hypothetical protein TWF128_002421 [Orbilia oligospora]
MAESTTRRPRTRAPRNRVRKRDRTFKNLPDADNNDNPEGGDEGEDQNGEGNGEEEDFSIGGKDTTNEGLARSLKRKRESKNGADNDNDVTMEDAGNGTGTVKDGNNNKKDKKKKEGEDGEGKVKQVHNEAYSNLLNTAKNKKRRERRKNAAAKARAGTGTGDAEEGSGEVNTGGDGDGDVPSTKQEGSGRKDGRFIVFVGNLPYTTTQATLTAHLSTVKPTGVRIATYKPGEAPKGRGFKSKKPTPSSSEEGSKGSETICKGYAFVEFPDAGRMKSCLSLFHHSEFEGRKINVELTAGGGGKSSDRKERVKAKNESLNTERKKRYEEDKKKRAERGEKVEEEKVEEEVEDGIHPSRRKRVRR